MSFRLILELEPSRGPDLKRVLRQIEIYGPLADALLVPDNHLGIPALSSLAIALEVRNQGFKPIMVINARDRNLLRLRSELITLRAYGIDEVLFVRGDRVTDVEYGITVRQMLKEDVGGEISRGVVATVGKPIRWRGEADFLVTKLAFGRSKAGYWREAQGFPHPVYCGVIALPDLEWAERALANIPDLDVPPGYLEAFRNDGEHGFRAAIAELDELMASGVDGAHIVVPKGWRRFSEMLEQWVAGKS